MAIKLTKTWTRESVDTPFFVYPAETKQHIADNYEATGKMTRVETNQAEANGLLSKVTVNIFRDAAALEEFLEDPTLIAMKDVRNDYNAANGITDTMPDSEEI